MSKKKQNPGFEDGEHAQIWHAIGRLEGKVSVNTKITIGTLLIILGVAVKIIFFV